MAGARDRVVLHGIFAALRDAGLPVSTRDYLDLLTLLVKLNAPFTTLKRVAAPPAEETEGMRALARQRVRERRELSWLLSVLCARNDKERRLIDIVVAREIGAPAMDKAERLLRELELLEMSTKAIVVEERPPSTPEIERAAEEQRAADLRNRRREDVPREDPRKKKPKEKKEPFTESPPEAEVEIADDGSLPIPPLDAITPLGPSPFTLELNAQLSFSWLTSVWRQLFIPRLEPDPDEIDPVRTVEAAAKVGRILAPVMRARRLNAARLLFLVDMGFAMTPWRKTLQLMIETFRHESHRYKRVGLAFFRTLPGETIFRTEALTDSIPTEDLFGKFAGTPVLILGEAGAARPVEPWLRRRIATFTDRLTRGPTRPIVWINPMPQTRWEGSLMDDLIKVPHLNPLELDGETLLEAMEFLRGTS